MPRTCTLEAYLDAQGRGAVKLAPLRRRSRGGVQYITLQHSAAYTAQELAAMLHVGGRKLAKTVIVKVAGQAAMVVLPASHRIDFQRLSAALGGKTVELAAEWEFAALFPHCEWGTMPPLAISLAYLCTSLNP